MKKMRIEMTANNQITSESILKFFEIQVNESVNKPSKRSGHRAICTKSDLYIWGGFCPPAILYPELWRFNFATSTWHLLETTGDIPSITVASPSVVLHGNSMVVYGGTGFPFGQNTGDALYVCNLKTLEWKRLNTTGDQLLGLYGSSMVIWNNYLYILYGTTAHEYCSNVFQVNLNTLHVVKLFDSLDMIQISDFTTLAQLEIEYPDEFLYGRYRQEVVLYQDQIFTFGGSKRNGESFSLDILPVFDLKTNKWKFVKTEPDADLASMSFEFLYPSNIIKPTFKKEYPEKRKFHSCFKMNSDVYVFGGVYYEPGDADLTLVENCVWKINLNTMRWKKLSIKMPKLTFFHASAISNEGVGVFHGGVSCNNGVAKRINNLYRINLSIPKLTNICWEKLLNSNENIVNVDKLCLKKIGIPMDFINRIN